MDAVSIVDDAVSEFSDKIGPKASAAIAIGAVVASLIVGLYVAKYIILGGY